MKLARIVDRTRETVQDVFAVRCSDCDPWTPVAGLGLRADDLPEMIAVTGAATERLVRGDCAPSGSSVNPELMSPAVRPGKIIAVGLNYWDHAREIGADPPVAPVTFAKYTSSIAGPNADIEYDRSITSAVDFEGELAVVIGAPTRRVTPALALDHVYGYAVANDVAARDLQAVDPYPSRAKSLDTFCPIGPWITERDEVVDVQNLRIVTEVNGDVVQDSSTAEMIFSVAEIVSYLSETMTLWPGDIILTGTPRGVGAGRKPPVYLQHGDRVCVTIAGLGALDNRVVCRP